MTHTEDIAKSSKMITLSEIAQSFNGEIFTIFFYEDVNSLVEHMMNSFSRPKVSLQFGSLAANPKPFPIDNMDIIEKHFLILPTSKLEENPFTWEKPEQVKIPKFPSKCLDNYSVIHFPEEAFYIPSDYSKNPTLFLDIDYVGVPRYFIDPNIMLIKKQALAVKGDVYHLESKSLVAKFKQLLASNPKIKKIQIPVFYFYQYEQNYQMMGYIKYEVYGKSDEFFKLEFKHYPLKYLQLNDALTVNKANMQKIIEKIIETLPRYSHNFYFSILKLQNITTLLKKRFKFMFGFSVSSSVTSPRTNWHRNHSKRITTSIRGE